MIAPLCNCAFTWLGSILKKIATSGKTTKRKYVITMRIKIVIIILSGNDLANAYFNIFAPIDYLKKGWASA
jgi:hypothetical protein